MDEEFLKEYDYISKFVPNILRGERANLSSDNLKTMCYGFYLVGKRVSSERTMKILKSKYDIETIDLR